MTHQLPSVLSPVPEGGIQGTTYSTPFDSKSSTFHTHDPSEVADANARHKKTHTTAVKVVYLPKSSMAAPDSPHPAKRMEKLLSSSRGLGRHSLAYVIDPGGLSVIRLLDTVSNHSWDDIVEYSEEDEADQKDPSLSDPYYDTI